MADTRTFEEYFASKAVLPGEQVIQDDQTLVLRAGTVFRAASFADGGVATMAQNATVTTIATINVWVPIAGTLTDLGHTDSFTFAANAYTFIGANRLHSARLEASLSVSKAGNGDVDFEIGLFVNGSQVGTSMAGTSSSDVISSLYCIAPYVLQTGDIVDVRIRNIDGIDNLLVAYAQLAIS